MNHCGEATTNPTSRRNHQERIPEQAGVFMGAALPEKLNGISALSRNSGKRRTSA